MFILVLFDKLQFINPIHFKNHLFLVTLRIKRNKKRENIKYEFTMWHCRLAQRR